MLKLEHFGKQIPGKLRNVVLEKYTEPMVRVKEDGKILRVMKREKANWIGHVLRRNCRVQHVIEGEIEVRSGGNTRKKT